MKTSVTISTIIILLSIVISCNNSPSSYKSFSGDKTIEFRVDSVLKQMTIDEKIGQMSQFSANWSVTGPVMPDDFLPYLEKGLVGSIFNATSIEGIMQFQKTAVEKTRLGIPILFGQDVIHGYKTIFPIPLAESCSWDLDLIRKTAEIAAEEASSEGINWTFAPMVDISRDARWGRVMEGAGEDPYLGSKVAEARVWGFQGGSDWRNLIKTNTLLACGKHLAAYGAAESGRDYNTAELSEHTLRNVYLPPYEAAQKAGVATFMASFNEINGVPVTANKWLLTNILRDEWGFRGFVVSDYTGINELVPHGVAKDEKQAAELAANAGVDMDMTGATFIKYLKQAVADGVVSENSIDNSVRRILEMKFLLGLFDNPYRYLDENRAKATIQKPEFIQTARTMVASSVVLLKNNNSILPINKSANKTIALIGPFINDSINLNGEWAGLGNRNKSITLLRGLTDKYMGSSIKLLYSKGCDINKSTSQMATEAINIAKKADVILVAMGEDFNWSGEAAVRTNINLPSVQKQLLLELKQLGKPLILVNFSGRPIDLSWEDENLDAIIQAWFPGSESGNGLADVIAGDYNPSARLTMSFPRNIGQIPIYYNQKNTGRPVNLNNESVDYKSNYIDASVTPLYPFGYGLSYTQFEISDVKLNKSILRVKDDFVDVSAKATNKGNTEGEFVVQLYTRQLNASVTRPIKELKGFVKLRLMPGETKDITFKLTSDDFAFYGIKMTKETEPGKIELWVSQHSSDETNRVEFEIDN